MAQHVNAIVDTFLADLPSELKPIYNNVQNRPLAIAII